VFFATYSEYLYSTNSLTLQRVILCSSSWALSFIAALIFSSLGRKSGDVAREDLGRRALAFGGVDDGRYGFKIVLQE
jgi:hypothetical protein